MAHLCQNLGSNRSKVVRKLIREAINGEIDLLSDEQNVLKIAIRQLIGMANNLNQIVAAMHSGTIHRSVDERYLYELKKYIEEVKHELQTLILKSKQRWVKNQ